jgi:hypothetical protein
MLWCPGSDGLPTREDSVSSSTQCSSRQLLCSLLTINETVFIGNHLLYVLRAPHSPGIALWDFWLFGRIKTGLAGRGFVEPGALIEAVREFMEGIPAAELTAVFQGWIDRVRWVIAHNRQYYSR